MVDLDDDISGARGASVRYDANWRDFAERITRRYDGVERDELDTRARRKDDLILYLHDRTGEPRAEVERAVDDVSRETGFRWG